MKTDGCQKGRVWEGTHNPVGVETIAATVSEDRDTIEQVYEPFLLRCGLLEKTPRGRKAAPLAYRSGNGSAFGNAEKIL